MRSPDSSNGDMRMLLYGKVVHSPAILALTLAISVVIALGVARPLIRFIGVIFR